MVSDDAYADTVLREVAAIERTLSTFEAPFDIATERLSAVAPGGCRSRVADDEVVAGIGRLLGRIFGTKGVRSRAELEADKRRRNAALRRAYPQPQPGATPVVHPPKPQGLVKVSRQRRDGSRSGYLAVGMSSALDELRDLWACPL